MAMRFKHFIFALLSGLALILDQLVHAQDQSGFISLDCGSPPNSNYTVKETGINYISDATFIDTGISKSVSPELAVIRQRYVWKLRSFPEGIRNCYNINVKGGTKYLIRATFLYGNYDGIGNLPQFDLYLGANTWDTVKVVNSSLTVTKELIHVVPISLNYLHLCLVNTDLGTPFISAIELRPLNNTTYVTESGSLALFWRVDVGSITNKDTDQGDVDAMAKIKSTYGIKRNWQGDPCAPQAYSWEGLNCSYDGSSPPRITSLNLSSSGLIGDISADISNLAMLQYLDLSNNSLTGSVPDFLSQLQYLTVLNLERNQLSGSVPAELIARSENGSLSLSVGDNPNLCGSGSCKKKKNSIVVPIVASLGALLILSLIVAAILLGLRRRKKQDKTKVLMFTMATLDDTQVAVKMLSPSSVQGFQQFQSEVKLLMRVHHRNLTTLVGYCYEGTNMGLIYEYMGNGDLQAHLSGEKANILNWEDRLRIATDAAQGLEYLHHGCRPPIIHRDVKCTNILGYKNIVDPRLRGNFNINSAWKAVEIAMACVSPTSAKRPTMSQVVAELKECLTTELGRMKEGHEVESTDSIEMINVNVTTELSPLAR
ncbi:hypothetical protein SLA2020_414290 [Shorea laevis]